MSNVAEYKPLQGNELWSEEFAMNDKISDVWSRIDTGASSHVTWRLGSGWLTAHHNSTACGSTYWSHHIAMDLADVGITPAVGFTVETYTRVLDRQDTTYTMSFLGLADGKTGGSGNQMMVMTHTSANQQSDITGLRDWTGYNNQVSYTNLGLYISHNAGFYTRLTYTAANSFTLRVSPNGSHWLASAAFSNTLTPTHISLGISNWNIAVQGMVGWKYVRVYDSHNNFDPYDTL